MLKCSTEVCGAADPGDSDTSGFSTAIKRGTGGHFHLFQLREFERRKSRIDVLGISLWREDSSKLGALTSQAARERTDERKSSKVDHPSAMGPWRHRAGQHPFSASLSKDHHWEKKKVIFNLSRWVKEDKLIRRTVHGRLGTRL